MTNGMLINSCYEVNCVVLFYTSESDECCQSAELCVCVCVCVCVCGRGSHRAAADLTFNVTASFY